MRSDTRPAVFSRCLVNSSVLGLIDRLLYFGVVTWKGLHPCVLFLGLWSFGALKQTICQKFTFLRFHTLTSSIWNGKSCIDVDIIVCIICGWHVVSIFVMMFYNGNSHTKRWTLNWKLVATWIQFVFPRSMSVSLDSYFLVLSDLSHQEARAMLSSLFHAGSGF